MRDTARHPEAGAERGLAGPRRSRRGRQVAAKTLAVVPTAFTLGNLLCGFAAVFIASRPTDTPLPSDWNPLVIACLLILLGMVFDGLDGGIARLTRNFSDLGAELDSLADMVTFGVAPAFVLVQTLGVGTPFVAESPALDGAFDRIGLTVALIFVACAGLRLARFNAEMGSVQEDDVGASSHHRFFSGLPSPGAAATLATMVMLHHWAVVEAGSGSLGAGLAAAAMLSAALLCALAMVSQLPYPHVLNQFLRQKASLPVIVLLVAVLLLLLNVPQLALAAAAFAYAASAPATWAWRRWRPRRPASRSRGAYPRARPRQAAKSVSRARSAGSEPAPSDAGGGAQAEGTGRDGPKSGAAA